MMWIFCWFVLSYLWIYNRTDVSYFGYSKIVKILYFLVDLIVLVPALFLISVKLLIDALLK